MTRFIDADALACKVDESKYNNPHPQGMVRVNHRNEHDHFLRMILDAPTVDAVEVVHGRNLKKEWPSLFECSVCGCNSIDTYSFEPSTINYCPNCGAKMDGEAK